MTSITVTQAQIVEERLSGVSFLRRSLRQIAMVLQLAIGAAYLALSSYGLSQGDFYPVLFAPAFFAIGLLLTWSQRFIDSRLDLIEADDRPLDDLDRDCFEQLSKRHPQLSSDLFPSDGVRRGLDLKLLSRSVPQ